MNQPFSTDINSGADQPATEVPPTVDLHQPWTADEIDQAVLEADAAWRQAGKITRYSQHLVHALVARLPSAFVATTDDQQEWLAKWRSATEADRAKPMLAVRWKADDGPWIYPTSIQAESLLACDIERCQVKEITTPVLIAKPALFVSPQQLEALQTIQREHYTPEGGHGRYLPVRAEPAGLFTQPLYTQSDPGVRPHLTEQDARLLNQAHEILLEHEEDQRSKGNDSQAMGAACSADAVLRLSAQALARPGKTPVLVAQLSPTAGMNLSQRIRHVGGRENAAGYIEFGSVMAVRALISQYLRDTPSPQQITQALRDNDLRVERVVMLDAMLGDQLYPAQALEHLMQEPTETLLFLFPGMPDWLRKALIDNVEFEDAFVEWVNQSSLSGFVVQFATPAMEWDASGESSTYSWGHYTTRWFYADSIDGAAAMALGWVKGVRQAEKSKGGA